jgi:hypothetical protein
MVMPRQGTTEILGCLTTVLLNQHPQHKIRRHERQSKVLLLRHRSKARLLKPRRRVRSHDGWIDVGPRLLLTRANFIGSNTIC